MKTVKVMIALAAMSLFAVSANAQFVKSGGGSNSASSDGYYSEPKKFTNEIDLYIQDGWGIGYQLRKDFNQYVGWNIFGVSYMSGFYSPEQFGQVNFKLLGARGYTPAYKSIRGYVDLNLGYTLCYFENYWGGGTSTSHHFGLDFSVGVQVHKNIAFGYNLNFIAPDNAKSHWARISFLF